MRVIFVCSGNTCRSPMAMTVLQSLRPHWQVQSRGIMVVPGQGMNPKSRNVLAKRGLEAKDHRAKAISEEDIRQADLVITMTKAQRDFLNNLTDSGKISTLADMTGIKGDIMDPYGLEEEVYEAVLEELTTKIKVFLQDFEEM